VEAAPRGRRIVEILKVTVAGHKLSSRQVARKGSIQVVRQVQVGLVVHISQGKMDRPWKAKLPKKLSGELNIAQKWKPLFEWWFQKRLTMWMS
jgi:hypothetical protein